MTSNTTISQPFDFSKDSIHTKQRGLWSQAWQRLIRNRMALVSGILLVAITALCVTASFVDAVQNHPPTEQVYSKPSGETNRNLGPNGDNWLGTDNLGRDNWSRLLDGALFSLKIGFGAEFIVVLIGITLGMLAALGGRLTDSVVMWVTDLAYAFPDLLAIILVRQVVFGRDWPILGTGDPQIPGLPSVLIATIVAISFVSWVTICRLIRGQMLSLKNQDYVMAARAIGASPLRVVRAHMLPNTLSTVIVAITFGIPTRIFAEAALAYIGLGVPPPAASLGSLIADGNAQVQSNPWMVTFPAVVIAILMLCFTFLGDGLRDALDPRTRK